MRCYLNVRRRVAEVEPPGGAEVTAFHRRLPGYAPTPLRPLPRLAAELGVPSVALKDESDRLGLPAFKIVGASWAIEQATRRWPEVDTLVAASAGNHGRAVARCAAQRGLACRIHLPAGAGAARAELIAAEGAEVVRAEGGYEAAVTAAEADAARPGAVLIADVARSVDDLAPRWVVDGYATLFREIAEAVNVLIVPIGVGSLAAAAVRWAAHEGHGCHVIGVEPHTAACVTASLRTGRLVSVPTPGTTMSGLDCATPSVRAWPTLRAGLAGTVTVDDDEVHDAMRELAADGFTIGDCGAAPVVALRRLITDPACAALREAVGLPDARVVCLATEGATDPDAYRDVVGN
jgi:diaminopropionate ammonia-lyase